MPEGTLCNKKTVDTKEYLDALLADEPCVRAGKMRFSRVVEFDAAQCQPVLMAWFGKEARQ
mgnify:CR=1 FL=1